MSANDVADGVASQRAGGGDALAEIDLIHKFDDEADPDEVTLFPDRASEDLKTHWLTSSVWVDREDAR